LVFVLEGWGKGENNFRVGASTANNLNNIFDKLSSYKEDLDYLDELEK